MGIAAGTGERRSLDLLPAWRRKGTCQIDGEHTRAWLRAPAVKITNGLTVSESNQRVRAGAGETALTRTRRHIPGKKGNPKM